MFNSDALAPKEKILASRFQKKSDVLTKPPSYRRRSSSALYCCSFKSCCYVVASLLFPPKRLIPYTSFSGISSSFKRPLCLCKKKDNGSKFVGWNRSSIKTCFCLVMSITQQKFRHTRGFKAVHIV